MAPGAYIRKKSEEKDIQLIDFAQSAGYLPRILVPH
jgi:hypothetical protein